MPHDFHTFLEQQARGAFTPPVTARADAARPLRGASAAVPDGGAVMASAAPRPTFSIGPLTMMIAAADLEAWLAGAATGDEIVYATGPTLPLESETVLLSRALIAEGVVTPFQRRNAATRGLEYVLRKRVADPNPPAPVRHVPPRGDDDLDARVLREISRAANMGLVCPSNMELARACGLFGRGGQPDADAASYRFRKLIAAGAIRSEDMGPNKRRIVTIVASGQKTVAGAL